MPIETSEFERWMNLLRSDVQGVHDRLDELNGRTRASEQKIAVLEDRSGDGRKGGMLAGGVVTGIAALAELVRHYLAK